MNSFGIIILWI